MRKSGNLTVSLLLRGAYSSKQTFLNSHTLLPFLVVHTWHCGCMFLSWAAVQLVVSTAYTYPGREVERGPG